MSEYNYKFNLQSKFFLIIVSTIIFICTSLVFFFVKVKKKELYEEVEKRGISEVKSLSYDAKYGVITEDTFILDHLIAGRLAKPDIKSIVITNDEGDILAEDTEDGYFLDYDSLTVRTPLQNDIYRSSYVSENGENLYIYTSSIKSERVSNPRNDRIIEDIKIFSGSKADYSVVNRGFVKIAISLDYVDKKVLETLYICTLIIFVVGTISAAGSFHFVGRIIAPIREIENVAREISKGDLSKLVNIRTNDEIGVMAENFNRMTVSLRNTIEELEEFKNDLELKVELRTEELEGSLSEQGRLLLELKSVNAELKDFAYIVSHDLKAPLRAISLLSTWILTDYGDKLDEEGVGQIKLLVSRTKRMHDLIEGVLRYSRAGQANDEIVMIDMGELVANVMDVVDPLKEIEFKIKCKLPSILGQETRIEQVVQNLLSNAVKYIDKPQAVIIIDCTTSGDFWQFSFSDNGPGIAKEHFERIFKMFQTLLSRDEFENTGVGLAVVKKIVEMYKGCVWVESEIGVGSTFFFTLPKV